MSFWKMLFGVKNDFFLKAAGDGDLEKVKTLLKDKPKLVLSKDAAGSTALHWAMYAGHKDVVELLLANNAPVNARDNDGETPLRRAAAKGHRDAAKLLLA